MLFKTIKHSILIIGATLLVGCGSIVDRGSFGSFHRSLSTTSHGYQVIPDPTGLAPTKEVERFEVRPGDCSADTVHSDCKTGRERSELAQSAYTPAGSEYWYGWYIYTPEDYPVVFPTKTAIGQFHQKDGPPAFMFQNSFGGYWIDRNFGVTYEIVQLLKDEQMRGKWVKIEVHALWHRENGFFRVYVNDELKYDFKGQTTTTGNVYFKYGVYRTNVKANAMFGDWKRPGTQVILFANVKRGKSRVEIQPIKEKAN